MPLVRQRRRGRGARRRGGELTDPAGAIRPAVEAALAVAREGLTADPVVLPPQALRRYLDFSRLSGAALRAIARVVERDGPFRERVAAAVGEDEVGRAGHLWLARPEGWEDELAAIEADHEARAEEERQAKEERSAVRKLAAAQAAAESAALEAEARARELEDLRAELARHRTLQAEVGARLLEAESAADRLAVARTEAVRNLKDVEARLVERSTELNSAKARIRELEERLRAVNGGGVADAPAGGTEEGPADQPGPVPSGLAGTGAWSTDDAVAPAAPAARRPGTDPAGERLGDASPSEPGEPRESGEPGESGESGGWPDRTALGAGVDGAIRGPVTAPSRDAVIRELGRAAAGAASLADSLASLAELLAPDAPGALGGTVPVHRGPGSDRGSDDAAAGDRPPAPRRVPLRLPGGVFDDSVEAADHLLRASGVVLVVDGYNVSMTGWPGMRAAEQRHRLVGALAELAARTATETEIVFDGAEVTSPLVPASVRSLVHVRFSPPGVEADDVVIDLVAQLPPARPVVVASSDNRVRDSTRRLGANLVHARQLLDALRR